MRKALSFIAVMMIAGPLAAQDWQTIGRGGIFNNDAIGDGRDRWRTGSTTHSLLRGRDPYSGPVPDFGAIVEYRLRSEIITRERPFDTRRHVGALAAGVATHFTRERMLISIGADVTVIGPQTGLARFQERFHDVFGLQEPATDNPVADDVRFSVRGEFGPVGRISDRLSVRPFIAGTSGVEDIFSTGFDILIGPVGQDDLWLRDPVTGQLYRGTQSAGTGISYVLGADLSRVGDSAYLPDDGGPEAAGTRKRARAGVHWQPSADSSFFYGLTYLSEEFRGQREGQLLGSLSLKFNF